MITESPRPRTGSIVVAAVAAGLLAMGAGLWLSRSSPDAAWQAALFYPEPRPIEPFTLTAADGSPFGPEDLTGAWDLVFFGFTHCPDVCPGTLAVLRDTRKLLAAGDAALPRVTLVSVDPERDAPAVMREYVAFFDPSFRAATGAPEALAAFALDLGAAFFVEEHAPGAGDYQVDHSASVMIVDPQGRLVGQLRAPPDAEAFAADLARLMAG